MKERPVDGQRAVAAHHQTPEVSQPTNGAFDDPAPLVATQLAPILRGWPDAILLVRTEQLDAPPPQTETQRVTVVAAITGSLAPVSVADNPDDVVGLRGRS